MVKLYDTLVLPVTKAAEQLVRPPFGQSVFAVARVPRADRPTGRPARALDLRSAAPAVGRCRGPMSIGGRAAQPVIWYVGRIVARARVWNARLKPTYGGRGRPASRRGGPRPARAPRRRTGADGHRPAAPHRRSPARRSRCGR